MSEEFKEQNESKDDTFYGCKNCGNLLIEEGYSVNLCNECRNKLSKRPIPMKIKLVSLLLFLIMIVSLLRFPHTIYIGVEYERGLQAEKASKYITAMHHYENVVKAYPQSDKALVRLYDSYYENGYVAEAYDVFNKIAGSSPSSRKMDKELVQQVNEITRKLDSYYSPSKELYDKLKGMKGPKQEDLIDVLKPFATKNPVQVYAAYYLADLYFDQKKFNEAKETMSNALSKNQDFYSGYLLQAAAYRELGKYDEAIQCANRVLDHNAENIGAYVTLSKIELKRKNNVKGLEYAKTAYDLDNHDSTVIANLALAYHFNNLLEERDKYYRIYQESNSKDKYTDDLLKSIFDGSLQWQI